jgi:hypothetical protein
MRKKPSCSPTSNETLHIVSTLEADGCFSQDNVQAALERWVVATLVSETTGDSTR